MGLDEARLNTVFPASDGGAAGGTTANGPTMPRTRVMNSLSPHPPQYQLQVQLHVGKRILSWRSFAVLSSPRSDRCQ